MVVSPACVGMAGSLPPGGAVDQGSHRRVGTAARLPATPTHSSVLAWEIPWTEEPGGLQSMGSRKSQQDLVTKNNGS